MALSSLLTFAANAQTNLLTAGDFEGISNPIGAYAQQTSAGVWGTESGSVTGAANGITPFGTQMFQINHSGGGTAAQTNQIVHGPFKAGSVATFSVKFNSWLTSTSAAPFPLQAAVSIQNAVLDSNPSTDNRSGTSYSSDLLILDTDPSTWQTATVKVILPTDTDYLSVELYVKMFSGVPGNPPLAYADDAVLTVVPPTATAPVISAPANITTTATSAAGAAVTFSATATSTESSEIFRRSTATAEAWQPYSVTFTSGVTGNYTLGFNVVSAAGGDNSIFIDSVKVVNGASTLLSDGFETPALANSSGVFADSGDTTVPVTLGSNWYFTNYGGILRGPGAPDWGTIANGTPPEGAQHAVLRDVISKQTKMTSTGQISLVAGQTYTVSFQQASREVFGGALTYTVTLDHVISVPVTATPASGSTFPVGTTTVNLSATSAGGTTTGSFNVTVNSIPTTIALGNLTQTYDGSIKSASATTTPTGVPVNFSYTGAQLPPIHAASYGVLASVSSPYTGTANGTLTINPAPATITIDPASLTGVYNFGPHPVTVTTTPAGLATSITYNGSPSAPSNAGSYSVVAKITNPDYSATPATGTLVIDKATATITFNNTTLTYDGTPRVVTYGVFPVGSTPVTLTYSGSPNAPINVGSYDLLAVVNDPNFQGQATGTLTVNPWQVAVNYTNFNQVYDGTPKFPTITLTPNAANAVTYTLNGTPTTPINAGHYKVSIAITDPNYTIGGGLLDFTINKATATVVVAPYTVTYDGQPHSATVTSITGVNGETDAAVGTVTLNTTHTNAGTYTTDSWFFTGSNNYNGIPNTPITDVINKATATVVVAPYTVPYDGQPHLATVTSLIGVNGENGATVGTVNLPPSHTNAGTYPDSWSFSGANYNSIPSTPITDVITKATPTVVVTPYNVIYDGQPHSATVTLIKGVNGENGATVGTVNLPPPHTNAGTYSSDSWSFAATPNYSSIASTPISDSIAKANAAVVVAPYNVEYDALAHSATVTSIIGVNGETGATVGIVNLNSTHTAVGNYTTDSWSLAATANYNNASGTITDVIKDTTPPAVTATMTARGGGDDESSQFFTLAFAATDLDGVKTVTALLNGVAVTNGQVVQLHTIKSGAQTVKRDDGKLQIKATSFALVVTATDLAGNITTKTVVPVFVKNGKDDENKKGGDDNGKGDDKKGDDDQKGSDDKGKGK